MDYWFSSSRWGVFKFDAEARVEKCLGSETIYKMEEGCASNVRANRRY